VQIQLRPQGVAAHLACAAEFGDELQRGTLDTRLAQLNQGVRVLFYVTEEQSGVALAVVFNAGGCLGPDLAYAVSRRLNNLPNPCPVPQRLRFVGPQCVAPVLGCTATFFRTTTWTIVPVSQFFSGTLSSVEDDGLGKELRVLTRCEGITLPTPGGTTAWTPSGEERLGRSVLAG
jgi:hypothetical protein